MRALPDYDFDVNWRPYQLAPDISREGYNKLEYYKQKFGESRVAQMIPHMEQVSSV